ncbi:MAG TPA: hypothetical protein VF843_04455 [Streptosporangiaceae bacterium]
MNGFQQACPRCNGTGNVHSIQELADMARAQLAMLQGNFGPAQQLGRGGPGYQPGVPGYMQEPTPGPVSDPRTGQRGGYGGSYTSNTRMSEPGEEIAGALMSEAAKFIGRRIGQRMQRTFTERVAPAIEARDGERLRTQIAISERHPEICACLDDNVVFLAGGRSFLPMPDLNTLTVEQADAMVATLRQQG